MGLPTTHPRRLERGHNRVMLIGVGLMLAGFLIVGPTIAVLGAVTAGHFVVGA